MSDRWRAISTVLGLVLIFLIGFAIAIVFLPGPRGPGASPTASLALGSPSPSPSATETPEASPSESGTPSGEPTLEPSGGASPSPTPAGPISRVSATLSGIGLDDPASIAAVERTITLTSHGTGDVTVRVSGVSRGRARLCLQYETGKPACINVANGTLTGKTKKRSTGWTITLAGATNGESPTAVLTISFPTRGPSLDLEDFRLAGTTSANGMRARVTARGPGSLRYSATWPDPTAYTAKAVDVGTGKTVRSTSGTATSAVIAVAVVRNHRYDITFGPRGSASADDIYFAAGLSWP